MLTSQDMAEMHFENQPKVMVLPNTVEIREDPMVAFYRRDNEELRKFLTAERVENNHLRSIVSDLREAVGIAEGVFMTPIGNGEMDDAEIKAVASRIRTLADRGVLTVKATAK